MKVTSLLTSLLFVCLFSFAQDGLVGYYDFESTDLVDGMFMDNSGNEYHAVSNGVSFFDDDPWGLVGGAAAIGHPQAAIHMTINKENEYELINDLESFTVAFWHLNSIDPWDDFEEQVILEFIGSNGVEYKLSIDDEEVLKFTATEGEYTQISKEFILALHSKGIWNHLAFSMDFTYHTFKFFINGEELDSEIIAFPAAANPHIYMGKPYNYAPICYDKLMIFDNPLSPELIEEISNNELGVNVYENETFSGTVEISPNPVQNDLLKVEVNGYMDDYNIEIIGVDGKRLVLERGLGTNLIDISSLNTGLHILRIVNGETLYTEKIVIK